MSQYTNKVKGSLLAAALGDALGSFGECLHYKAIDRIYRVLPPEGFKGTVVYSDDTALRLVLYETILSSEINAYTLAEQWSKKVVDNQVYWTSELYVTAMILMGHDPHVIGHRNLLGDNAAMAVDPIGALYPSLDEIAALRTFETMSVCQSGKGLEGAMAVAAAVSKSMIPESSIDDIVDAAGRWVSKDMKNRIEDAVSLVSTSGDARKVLYDRFVIEDGLTDLIRNEINSPIPVKSAQRLTNLHAINEDISMGISPLEVVPIAIAYVTKGEVDPINAIKEAARFGRDCDTIAGITGAILGAFHGTSSLPQDLLGFLPTELLTKADEIASGMNVKASQALTTAREHCGLLQNLFG